MPKPKQRRDNRYYLDRLRDEHPAIFADYQAGKFKNASEAFAKAGLRNQRSSLQVLKSEWNKASVAERDAFKALIGCVANPNPAPSAAMTTTPVVSSLPPATAIHLDGRLTSSAAAQIQAIMIRRGITSGTIMRELGFNPLDASLGLALQRGSCIKNQVVLDALSEWLKKNPN
ncbi:hypothetical protein EGN72_07180 [Pseudorhodobacter sp. E13]|uniref:hypothetical protein n=1 Tax=Pseudorhodobacter sp. E13 TaxID=2487931 RepID=UPI000F8E1D10|nr:hypothetical protein [Pseudorhodobacter sp. E13]RUS60684.1 hypothetical protein EGN72_07180 [Pseudorhodobacter sp. E13]